jgi:predicted CopG family antitoxin
MAKMVQLSDEAYRRLRAAKPGNESFSDVVVRLTQSGDLAGLAALQDAAGIREAQRLRSLIDEVDREDVARRGRN